MAVKTVEEYIQKHPDWEDEIVSLREMLLSTELEEAIKWGGPVYSLNGKNVVGIGAFKNHCSLWFFQGALLRENTALLQNAQEGKTKALRQIRFEKGNLPSMDVLRKYVQEAIQNQKEGKELKPVKNKEVEIPPLLETAFEKDSILKKAFMELTPGRQREYCEHIAEAKREATKLSRLTKITPMIKSGQGLHDKYKNC
ncbi:YdeI/OmpD-associated family protein [Salinimicrobium catena]|uniref:YdeI/OmpD-associated family protein n=1 Tax=Salinimicrobium catena TaxID=390640 RepID=UPI002FE46080